MACSSGCPTPGRHQSYGECLRGKALQVADVEAHQEQKQIYREQNDYRAARDAGLQPASCRGESVRQAWKITDATGVPYRADKV